jgi:uncharacterized protein (TIGR00156 family)
MFSAPLRPLLIACFAAAAPAAAQFTGPGGVTSAAEAQGVRLGAAVVVEGRILERLREDYYRFADDSGEIRVEIEPEVWGGRAVGPETIVRLGGDMDPHRDGGRYLSVETLAIVE